MFSHENSDAARFFLSFQGGVTWWCGWHVHVKHGYRPLFGSFLSLLKFPKRHRLATGTGQAAHLLRPPAPDGNRHQPVTRYRPGTWQAGPEGTGRPPAPAGHRVHLPYIDVHGLAPASTASTGRPPASAVHRHRPASGYTFHRRTARNRWHRPPNGTGRHRHRPATGRTFHTWNPGFVITSYGSYVS